MNFSSIIIPFVINIIICFGIPIGYLIYLIVGKKGRIKSYICGALVFIISQVFLRIPIIQGIMPKLDWYITMSIFNPIVYCLFLGITAGIFEEVGRFLGFKRVLKNERSWEDGIAFGVGHGGVEAMLITGGANIQNLIMVLALKNGNFNSSKFGISEESFKVIFESVTSMDILFAGVERVSAICIHIGLTLLVLYGINKGKKLSLGLAILIHGAIDFVVSIFSQIGISIYLIELWCAVCAVILLVYSIKSKKLFKGEVSKSEKNL